MSVDREALGVTVRIAWGLCPRLRRQQIERTLTGHLLYGVSWN